MTPSSKVRIKLWNCGPQTLRRHRPPGGAHAPRICRPEQCPQCAHSRRDAAPDGYVLRQSASAPRHRYGFRQLLIAIPGTSLRRRRGPAAATPAAAVLGGIYCQDHDHTKATINGAPAPDGDNKAITWCRDDANAVPLRSLVPRKRRVGTPRCGTGPDAEGCRSGEAWRRLQTSQR
jgi:hypothetical protein